MAKVTPHSSLELTLQDYLRFPDPRPSGKPGSAPPRRQHTLGHQVFSDLCPRTEEDSRHSGLTTCRLELQGTGLSPMSSAENVPLVNPTTAAASLAHQADGAVETCCHCPLIRTQRLRSDVKMLTSYKCLFRSGELTMAALWSSKYQPGSHVSLLLCFQCPPPLCVSVCTHI